MPAAIFAERKGHSSVARRERVQSGGKSRISTGHNNKEGEPYTIWAYGTLNEDTIDPIRTNLRPPKARQTRVYRITKYTTTLRERKTKGQGHDPTGHKSLPVAWNWRKEYQSLLAGRGVGASTGGAPRRRGSTPNSNAAAGSLILTTPKKVSNSRSTYSAAGMSTIALPDFEYVSPYPQSPSSRCGLRPHEKLFKEFYSDYKMRASMLR